MAIIRVGAPTEIEMIEKKHRIEDALEAVRSAQKEGIVPGGGTTLFKVAGLLDDISSKLELTNNQQRAVGILKLALVAPFYRIADNAGYKFSDVNEFDLLRKENKGINFLTGEVVDMLDAGVVDPAKVVKNALRNAISAAGTLLIIRI